MDSPSTASNPPETVDWIRLILAVCRTIGRSESPNSVVQVLSSEQVKARSLFFQRLPKPIGYGSFTITGVNSCRYRPYVSRLRTDTRLQDEYHVRFLCRNCFGNSSSKAKRTHIREEPCGSQALGKSHSFEIIRFQFFGKGHGSPCHHAGPTASRTLFQRIYKNIRRRHRIAGCVERPSAVQDGPGHR